MKRILTGGLALGLALTAAPVVMACPEHEVQMTPTAAVAPAATINAVDQQFAVRAAEGGIAEVALGQLALTKATHPDVKAFAQRMITDHGKANQQLMATVQPMGIMGPHALDTKHQAIQNQLMQLSGPAFDRAYIQAMVQDHQEDIALFQIEAQAGTGPLQALAAQTLPILQQHLQQAQSILQTLGSP